MMTHLEHFIFTPKYRRAMLGNYNVAYQTEALIRHIASLKNIEILACAIQPDHVHVFVALPRTMSVAQAAHLLKWFSSCHLRRQFPQLKQNQAHLWGHRYFHRSVGGDQRQIRQYIHDQIRDE